MIKLILSVVVIGTVVMMGLMIAFLFYYSKLYSQKSKK